MKFWFSVTTHMDSLRVPTYTFLFVFLITGSCTPSSHLQLRDTALRVLIIG